MNKIITAILSTFLMLPLSKASSDIDVIELTKENTVALRDAVTWSSMSQLQFDLLQKSSKLDDDEPIILVLDTPGGSVPAGEMFIETLSTIKQPVHVVVLFAASMGFQITQAADKRFIIPSGTLMSHRATIRLAGQLDGELESRLDYYKGMVNSLEERSAGRLGLSLDHYKSKIVNEWWEFGQDAVTSKMADKVVRLKCSEELNKSVIQRTVMSLFGSSVFNFSACPLITTPVKLSKTINTNNILKDQYFNLLYNDKNKFVNTYVTTGMFNN